jgi:hypothetical protein
MSSKALHYEVSWLVGLLVGCSFAWSVNQSINQSVSQCHFVIFVQLYDLHLGDARVDGRIILKWTSEK